jgi:predicted ester cyclase
MQRNTFFTTLALVGMAAMLTSCLCGPCEEATINKEIALAAFEVIAAGELDKLDEYVAADYVRHCQATPDVEVTSLQDFKDYLVREAGTIPEPELTVTHLIAEDNLVAFWAVYSGIQEGPMGPFPATGKKMELDFSGFHRLEGGKIVETWVTWDNLAALSQLGHFPPPPLEEPEQTE